MAAFALAIVRFAAPKGTLLNAALPDCMLPVAVWRARHRQVADHPAS
jgi:hypothetical protein